MRLAAMPVSSEIYFIRRQLLDCGRVVLLPAESVLAIRSRNVDRGRVVVVDDAAQVFELRFRETDLASL